MVRGMSITVRLFAILRERAGRESADIAHTPGMTVDDALDQLVAMDVLAADLPTEAFLCAVNHEYADRSTKLQPSDELALIPPVSGG